MKTCTYCKTNPAKNIYCSTLCANRANAKHLSKTRKGSGNPMYGKIPHNYNFGLTSGKSGSRHVLYTEVRIDGRKTKQHRIIMEAHLGRKLRSDEIVHHKDGNGQNNNINNLVLMSISAHSRLHADVAFLRGKGGYHDQANV